MITYRQTAEVQCDRCGVKQTFQLSDKDVHGVEPLAKESELDWVIRPDMLDGGSAPIVLCGPCDLALLRWVAMDTPP